MRLSRYFLKSHLIKFRIWGAGEKKLKISKGNDLNPRETPIGDGSLKGELVESSSCPVSGKAASDKRLCFADLGQLKGSHCSLKFHSLLFIISCEHQTPSPGPMSIFLIAAH